MRRVALTASYRAGLVTLTCHVNKAVLTILLAPYRNSGYGYLAYRHAPYSKIHSPESVGMLGALRLE